jgi:GNAT superfamily N-acetyltransferase
MIDDLVIRSAVASEQKALEALQRRASLGKPGDHDALLATAIELPIEQIVAGQILVAEQDCGLVGFAVVLPREDGAVELDGLFVDPSSWRRGIGRLLVDRCAEVARANRRRCTSSATVMRKGSTCRAASRYGTTPTRLGVGLSMHNRL